MTSTDTLLPTDGELVQFGYAPGHYYGQCQGCKNELIAAKRAWHCKPCAIAAWSRRTPPTPATDTPGTYGTMTPTIEVVPPHYPLATDEREAVARAICASHYGADLWESMLVSERDDWLRDADAALSALAPIRAAALAAETLRAENVFKTVLRAYENRVGELMDERDLLRKNLADARAEILAAEANERARIVAWLRAHQFAGAEKATLRYAAECIEGNQHGADK